MDTKTRMVEGHPKNLAILTVCGSLWLVCCNKEVITRPGIFQVLKSEHAFRKLFHKKNGLVWRSQKFVRNSLFIPIKGVCKEIVRLCR